MNYRFSPLALLIISFCSLNAQQLTFVGDTVDESSQLGFDVAMTENFAISSAWQKDIWYKGELKQDAGCVYLHKKEDDKWVYQHRITCPKPRKGDAFGRSIDVSDEYLVVGAVERNPESKMDSRFREGAVFIYQRSETSYVYKYELKSDKLEADVRFGENVALEGQYLAVVCNYPENGVDSKKYVGAVLVYKLTKEAAPKKIATLTSSGDLGVFEYSIAIHGDLLVVGELGNRVSVYKLKDESVKLIQELLPEPGNETGFGDDVAASDNFIAVGTSGGEYSFYGVDLIQVLILYFV